MAFIGNTVQTIPFITDTFSGTGAQTVFTPLTRAPAGSASIAVFISGVYQAPSTYTLSGVTITFGSAPAAGAGNIVVLHLGNGSATQVPSDGSVTLARLANDTYAYINAAFAAANSDTAVANSGAAYANSGFAVANSAALYANSAFLAANNSAGTNLTQNTNITNAGTYANSAFLAANTPTHVANSAASYANGAFTKANTVVVTLSGTTNQITANSATGNVVLSYPATIIASSNVQYTSLGVGTLPSNTTGEIRATNNITAYYSSDKRYKKNIINIQNPLEKIQQINGVEFDWTEEYMLQHGGEDGYFIRQHDVGVIAQEIETILPEIVATREDGYKAVKYDRIVALLIEAIKELKKEIDGLKK